MTALGLVAAALSWGQSAIGIAASAAQVYYAPPPAPEVNWQPAQSDDLRTLYRTSFPSAMTSPFPENNEVPVWLSVPNGVTKPGVVLILHYLGAADLRAEESLALQLNRKGLAAAYIALPYHLGRTPDGYKSGQLAITPSIENLQWVAMQSVLDVRRTVDILQSRNDISTRQLGIAGVSLGSLVSELSFAVDPRFQHCAFILGGAGIGGILWHSAAVVPVRNQLKRMGFTERSLSYWLWPIDPVPWLALRNQTKPASDALVIAAKYDQIMPPIGTQRLLDSIPNASTFKLDTGHYGGFFAEAKIDQEVAKYFQLTTSGQPYSPPRSFSAPTVRLIAQAITTVGFDIGVGVDLFRSHETNPLFGTFVVTPRGVEIFLGQELGAGFSVGVAAGNRGAGVGLFWSAIL